ncbi:hypothetical protein [Ligilactobacillus saerimneri]|nr:hypothetical protein [Ligilactobacillus saerimneri]
MKDRIANLMIIEISELKKASQKEQVREQGKIVNSLKALCEAYEQLI